MPESKKRKKDQGSSRSSRRIVGRGSGDENHPRSGRSKRGRDTRRWLMTAAAVIVAVLIIGSFGLTAIPFNPRGEPTNGAQQGDHWHASLSIEICGESMSPLPPSGGGIHSHGQDSLIHIHPQHGGEAGSNANLGLFFDSFSMIMDSDSIQLPGGELHRDGDVCSANAENETATVQVLVNDDDVTETFKSYIPQNDDQVAVYFR